MWKKTIDVKIILGVGIAVICLYFALRPKCFRRNNIILEYLRKKLEPVHPVIKTIPLYESNSSFSENKNSTYICLRDENGDLYDENTLIYVMLHEFSHIIDEGVSHGDDHTPSFYKIFNEILKKAIALKLYNPDIPLPKNYCGLEITTRHHYPV